MRAWVERYYNEMIIETEYQESEMKAALDFIEEIVGDGTDKVELTEENEKKIRGNIVMIMYGGVGRVREIFLLVRRG